MSEQVLTAPGVAAGARQSAGSGQRAAGRVIRDVRLSLGWSQTRLAAALCDAASHDSVTRETISRWEHGKRHPGSFWLPHLADILQVPPGALEDRARGRAASVPGSGASVPAVPVPAVPVPAVPVPAVPVPAVPVPAVAVSAVAVSAVAVSAVNGTAVVGPARITDPDQDVARELYASIAGGDAGPLARVQTTHGTDLVIAALARQERSAMLRLSRWMNDGDTGVLRVNAAGILAKTRDPDYCDAAAAGLDRDIAIRTRYLRAVSARVGTSAEALAAEISNPRDAGARWCAAWLIGQDPASPARGALHGALRTETVTENIRLIALILTGAQPSR